MTRTDDIVSIEAHALGIAANCPMCELYEIREQNNRMVIEIQEQQYANARKRLASALRWESAFWAAVLVIVFTMATLAIKK